jgi:hypothetical protein
MALVPQSQALLSGHPGRASSPNMDPMFINDPSESNFGHPLTRKSQQSRFLRNNLNTFNIHATQNDYLNGQAEPQPASSSKRFLGHNPALNDPHLVQSLSSFNSSQFFGQHANKDFLN